MKRVALLALLFVTGCLSPLTALRDERALAFEAAAFTLRSNGASPDVTRIEQSLEKAPQALARWGSLRLPVTVYVVPTHAALESAVGRPGYGWLRAWARFDDVIFQAPSTWARGNEVLDELVTHELTHCLMFQAIGDADTWEARRVPLWFREGMAVATAHQQHRYPAFEDTARWLEANPDLDPFGDAERLSEKYSLDVYGVALHAFEFLLNRHHDEIVPKLFEAMRSGKDFAAAFTDTVGQAPADFERDFRHFLKRRGFRNIKKSVPTLEQQLEERQRSSTQGRTETTPVQ